MFLVEINFLKIDYFFFTIRFESAEIKFELIPRAGILIYSTHPFLSASSLYSISSSTKVSECSETKAIGTKTIFFHF